MTQLLSMIDEAIRYSDHLSRDRQQSHVYDLLLEIRQKIRKLENDYENILQQNEKLRGAIYAKKARL